MNNEIRHICDLTWENIVFAAGVINKEKSYIVIDENKKNTYYEHVENLINNIKQYMKKPEELLDRHKIAAIIMISVVKTEPLILKEEKSNLIFTSNYVVAVEAGLAYMRAELNQVLEEKGISTIDKYFFPKSWICKNDYFKVFYRNLYFSNNNADWGLNPLEIAEKLFLFEYITLLKEGVNVSKLEYK